MVVHDAVVSVQVLEYIPTGEIVTALNEIARVLKPGGEFLFKTDHPAYFEAAMECLTEATFFKSLTWEDEMFYPQTDFEELWLGQGKPIHRAHFKKIS